MPGQQALYLVATPSWRTLCWQHWPQYLGTLALTALLAATDLIPPRQHSIYSKDDNEYWRYRWGLAGLLVVGWLGRWPLQVGAGRTVGSRLAGGAGGPHRCHHAHGNGVGKRLFRTST